MISEQQLFSLTYAMSEMAARHPNDVISNQLAATSHKLTQLGSRVTKDDLDERDRIALRYFHQKKGEFQILGDLKRPRERQRDAGFHEKTK